MRRCMRNYLSPIPSKTQRGKIRQEALRLGFVFGKIGDTEKEILAEAIFQVENDREHVRGHREKNVVGMRRARNQVYDDLGWNEVASMRKACDNPKTCTVSPS